MNLTSELYFQLPMQCGCRIAAWPNSLSGDCDYQSSSLRCAYALDMTTNVANAIGFPCNVEWKLVSVTKVVSVYCIDCFEALLDVCL